MKNTANNKKTTVKKDHGPSNKMQVYQKWNHGKGETDVVKLTKAVQGRVKESTVRGWLSAWGRGTNLPGGVKKGR